MTEKTLKSRPPVVVFLGHIDAGKSSILSYIQKTDLTKNESGGITQHIKAYETLYNNKKIVFIDTPGHAAFSSIRSRGAKIADIAVLVVGIDQGVLPQTKEAIAYLKETKIPVIVAFNKIDQNGLPLEKIKAQLADEGLVLESRGGPVPAVETSAKTGQGIDDLLGLILLLAEMENLQADEQRPAEGFILESYLDRLKGPIVSLLVKNGQLKVGDVLGTASSFGKIKEIKDWQNKNLEEALPSQPVRVLGFKSLPIAGENFRTFSSLEEAQSYLQKSSREKSEKNLSSSGKEEKHLNLVLKADAFSSLEALKKIIAELKIANRINIVKAEVGDVNQNDVQEAVYHQAEIIGFRVKANPAALALLKRNKIIFKSFMVIYDLLDYVREETQRLTRQQVRQVEGRLEVLAVFWAKKNRQIVGGKVVEGEFRPGLLLEIFRGTEKIGQGKIVSLERDQKKVEKVKKGQTAGILYEGSGKITQGDILEAYSFCYN